MSGHIIGVGIYRGWPYPDFVYAEATTQGLYYDFNLGIKGRISDPLFLLIEIGYVPDGSLLRVGLAFEL